MTANQDSDPTPSAGDHIVVGHITNAEGVAIGENARVEINRYGDVIVRVDSLEELPPTPGEPPYKGLTYYTETDEDIFFGREQLSDDLAARLQTTPFLAVAGASGSGKSSLLRAGVVPRLRRRNWLALVLTPTADPLGQLAAVLSRDDKELSAADELRGQLVANHQALRQKGSRLVAQAGAERLLLIVDQFEELFTQCHDEGARRAFIENLLAATTADSRVTVLIGLRADFTGRLAEVEALRALVEQNFALLGPMQQEDLVRVIAEPARLGGWAFVSGLVEQFLSDVGQEPGRLPLLSHALLETWTRRAGHVMTLKGYREAGGVEGAIAKTAEDILRRMEAQGEQAIVQAIFLSLTELGEGSEDTRRIARRDELARAGDPAAVEAVLNTLAAARLVTLEADSIQVAHEALIRRWPRLREWLADNRERLRFERQLEADALEWERLGRDDGALYRGARLVQAREWRKDGRWSSPLLDEFLDASSAEAEKEAQEARQLVRAGVVRRFAYALGALLVVALSLAVVAGVFALQARNARTAVENLNRDIRSRRLAAESGLSLTLDPERALLLAVSAYQTTRGGDNAPAGVTTGEARAALYKALQSPFRATLTGADTDISTAAFSPDEMMVVTGGWTGDVSLWDAENGRLIRKFAAHDRQINSAVFNPDGSRILTASWDTKARLWDAATGEMVAEYIGHEDTVYNAIFSPDGKKVLTESDDGTARLWDMTTGEPLLVLDPEAGGIDNAAFSPDGALVVTTSGDGVARIWDAGSGEVLVELGEYSAYIYDVAFSPDGSRIVTAADDGTARIWATGDGENLSVLSGHEGWVNTASFSPDGTRVVTSGTDNTARVWDAATGRRLVNLIGHSDWVNTAAFNHDGTQIITSSNDRTARIWDAASGALLAELTGHTEPVIRAAFGSRGSRAITVSEDFTARLWDMASIAPPLKLVGGSEGVNAAAFSPDGQRVVTANRDGIARTWESSTGELLDELPQQDSTLLFASFSPDGRRILTADDFKTARIWNVASGELLHEFDEQFRTITSAVYSPDGTRVVAASLDGAARIWDAESGELLWELVGHNGEINSAAFSPDGKRVVTAGADDTARIWDTTSGTSQAELIGHADDLVNAVFSPDGTRVATGSRDRTARIWDAATGVSLFELTGHSATITHVAFSPDSTRLITTSGDGTARIWDAATGEMLFELLGHTDWVTFAAFSGDGRRVVTTSRDTTARIWDTASGQLETSLTGHEDWILSAAFSPDSRRLLTVSTDGTTRIWSLQPGDMLAAAQARIQRAPVDVDAGFCARYFQDAPDECPATLVELFPEN